MSLTSVKEYFTPDSKEEVLELLETYGGGALIVAGGSFVHGLDARDLLTGIEALIDIQNLGLKQVTSDSSGLSVGAMVTFSELQQVKEIQNSAALGAVRDAFDLPTAIMCVDGVVQAQGSGGSREIELQDFFFGLFQSTLKQGEFVTGLFLPRLPTRSSSAFIKLETNANDLAIVNVAVRVSLDESGVCRQARVVIGGGVAETPVRAVTSDQCQIIGRQQPIVPRW